MQIPEYMPQVLRLKDQPNFALATQSGIGPQGLFDPRNIACAAACSRKAGYIACLARCIATGQACDGGIDNCQSV